MDEAAARIQAGLKGMLARRSIRSEMQGDTEEQPEKHTGEEAEEHKDTVDDDDADKEDGEEHRGEEAEERSQEHKDAGTAAGEAAADDDDTNKN